MRTRTRWTTSAAVPLLLLALVTLPAIASIEKANPEDVGLCPDRLARIHDAAAKCGERKYCEVDFASRDRGELRR